MSEFQVPDAVSFEDLREAMEAATPEQQDQPIAQDADGLFEQARACVLDATNLSDMPAVFHKAMVLNIIENYIDWHNLVAEEQFKSGDLKSAASWLRDCGKFQAIMNIITTIRLDSDDDFVVSR